MITPGFKPHDLLSAEAEVIFSYPVKGKSFLDIGAWDGFFSFQAERRGASRVLAIDRFGWGGEGCGTQDGFNYARATLKPKVEDKEVDLFDITTQSVGVFDVVLLSGVRYHVKDPLSVLEQVSAVTKECLIAETAVALVDHPEPAMAFLHALDWNDDPTNWWAPNPACVIAMLKVAGFKTVLLGEHPTNPRSHATNPRSYFFALK